MKTIIEKNTRLSKYIFQDDVVLDTSTYYIAATINGVTDYMTDVNGVESDIISNVEAPSDWKKDSYRYEENTGWKESNGLEYLSLDESKIFLNERLKDLRKDLASLINECLLINNPVPTELQYIIDQTRGLYAYGKEEINGLTEENYRDYVLAGPQVKMLFQTLQSYL